MSGVLRLGVALADMSEFVQLDPAYGIGDQRAQVEALVAAELDSGGLPGGADVELVFREFSSTDIDDKRSVADWFAAAGVLAVIGARDFTYGSVRLAERHRIPVIDVNAVPRTIFARTDPWLFTIRAAQDLVYRTYVEWAHGSGRLTGRRIGVFSDRFTATSSAAAIARLGELGHEVVAHVASDGVGVASDRDTEVIQRFDAAGVDLMMPFVSGSSLASALRVADAVGYRPVVLDLETGEHATDVSGSAMPASIYEGTSALVMSRVGEVAAGRSFDARAERMVSIVERATGCDLARSGRASSGALSNVLMVADLVSVTFSALRAAGAAADGRSLVASLERIAAMPSASGGRLSFRPTEHWGCREMREIVWERGLWRAVGEYAPIATAPERRSPLI